MRDLYRFVVGISTVLFMAHEAHAQPEILYYGSDGEVAPYVEPFRNGPAYVETYGEMRGGITFSVEYLDVTNNNNVGFDDPVLGATRRATFEAVLAYINSELAEVGAAQIEVQLSQFDGSGALAFAGPFYFVTLNCQENLVFKHITTGIDPSGGPDARVTVDFGFNWNSDLGAPAFTEYDLFSVLLHELTHALGFTSLITNSAGGGLQGFDPDVRAAGFSNFLRNGNGAALINCANGDFVGVAADLTGGNGGLKHAGPNTVAAWQALGNAGNAPLYAPASFQPGSSTSHWSDGVLPNCVMRRAISNGVQVREYSTLDLGALDDLGYDLAVAAICPADIDGDGDADMADRTAFVQVLLGTPINPSHIARADLNASGAANGADVQQFVTALIAGCP